MPEAGVRSHVGEVLAWHRWERMGGDGGHVEGHAYITQPCCSCLMHRSCVHQCCSNRHCAALTSQHAVACALLDEVARGGNLMLHVFRPCAQLPSGGHARVPTQRGNSSTRVSAGPLDHMHQFPHIYRFPDKLFSFRPLKFLKLVHVWPNTCTCDKLVSLCQGSRTCRHATFASVHVARTAAVSMGL